MVSDDDDRLAPEGLYAEREPPPELEERVIADWRRAYGAYGADGARGAQGATGAMGGEGSVRVRAGTLPVLYSVAAGLVLFLAGWGSARLAGGPMSPPGLSAPTYMLLLWEGPGFGGGVDPESFGAEYAAWAQSVERGGVRLAGEELAAERTWVPPGGAGGSEAPTDGGFRLGGYFVLEVRDAETALRIARSHPHATHGGWVEVAQVVGGR